MQAHPHGSRIPRRDNLVVFDISEVYSPLHFPAFAALSRGHAASPYAM